MSPRQLTIRDLLSHGFEFAREGKNTRFTSTPSQSKQSRSSATISTRTIGATS